MYQHEHRQLPDSLARCITSPSSFHLPLPASSFSTPFLTTSPTCSFRSAALCYCLLLIRWPVRCACASWMILEFLEIQHQTPHDPLPAIARWCSAQCLPALQCGNLHDVVAGLLAQHFVLCLQLPVVHQQVLNFSFVGCVFSGKLIST